MKETEQKDSWSPDGQVFIHYGKGYCVAPNLQTVYIGEVDELGRPVQPILSPSLSVRNQLNGVSKLDPVSLPSPEPIIPILASKSKSSFETSKHPGGRPRKTKDLSRSTLWRRQRELDTLLPVS